MASAQRVAVHGASAGGEQPEFLWQTADTGHVIVDFAKAGFENILLLIREDGEYQGVAPAYDILPMCHASLGGGVAPLLPCS